MAGTSAAGVALGRSLARSHEATKGIPIQAGRLGPPRPPRLCETTSPSPSGWGGAINCGSAVSALWPARSPNRKNRFHDVFGVFQSGKPTGIPGAPTLGFTSRRLGWAALTGLMASGGARQPGTLPRADMGLPRWGAESRDTGHGAMTRRHGPRPEATPCPPSASHHRTRSGVPVHPEVVGDMGAGCGERTGPAMREDGEAAGDVRAPSIQPAKTVLGTPTTSRCTAGVLGLNPVLATGTGSGSVFGPDPRHASLPSCP